MMRISHSNSEVQKFWHEVEAIRKSWCYTEDNDTDTLNELFVDLLQEIEDFLEIPQGN